MKTLILIAMLIFVTEAFAGGSSIGNGGVGLACGKVKVSRAVLFDLFEGESVSGIKLSNIDPTIDYKVLARRKILELANLLEEESYKKLFSDKLERFMDAMNFLPPDVGLQLTEDIDTFILPKNCEFVQLINYRENGDIFVDSEYWGLLSDIHKAALLVHEVLYQFLRENSETSDQIKGNFSNFEKDSRRTRKLVALLFSDQPLLSRGLLELKQPTFHCDNRGDDISRDQGVTEFILIPRENGKAEMRFTRLSGRLIVTRAQLLASLESIGETLFLNSSMDDAQLIVHSFSTISNGDLIAPEVITIREANRKVQYYSHFQCAIAP